MADKPRITHYDYYQGERLWVCRVNGQQAFGYTPAEAYLILAARKAIPPKEPPHAEGQE